MVFWVRTKLFKTGTSERAISSPHPPQTKFIPGSAGRQLFYTSRPPWFWRGQNFLHTYQRSTLPSLPCAPEGCRSAPAGRHPLPVTPKADAMENPPKWSGMDQEEQRSKLAATHVARLPHPPASAQQQAWVSGAAGISKPRSPASREAMHWTFLPPGGSLWKSATLYPWTRRTPRLTLRELQLTAIPQGSSRERVDPPKVKRGN